ncbi:hypothetical protein BSK59_15980 [Paenibacillus odorifer]|uniref:hypothetical protein n=1 Tax=Paenibacillus odorifer TaxID=189426 RepID=UPI00096DD224|nr:hypothetical protein [Paenibacillus odorifer]OME54079.1 hypothetical protein BSK59_15980 [Paenibacillus odorifer]
MVKVYANEVGHAIESEELVEIVQGLRVLRQESPMQYALMYKDLCNGIREDLGINNLISLVLMDEITVGVFIYNIVAGDFDVFQQGQDENGLYIEVGV